MKTFLLALAGPSGTGKTSLADLLVNELSKENSVILSADRYYRDLSHLPKKERDEVNFDEPEALNHAMLSEHLKALKDGKAIEAPNYDFVSHTRKNETTTFQPVPYIIVEGLFLLTWEDCRDLFDLRVYTSASHDECLKRRLVRDSSSRGRKKDDIIRQYERTVRPMCDMHITPSSVHADVIVDARNTPEHSCNFIMERLIPNKG